MFRPFIKKEPTYAPPLPTRPSTSTRTYAQIYTQDFYNRQRDQQGLHPLRRSQYLPVYVCVCGCMCVCVCVYIQMSLTVLATFVDCIFYIDLFIYVYVYAIT